MSIPRKKVISQVETKSPREVKKTPREVKKTPREVKTPERTKHPKETKPIKEKKERVYLSIKEDDILGCKKLKRDDANELAEKLSVNPSDFKNKNEVCNEVRKVWFSGYISELDIKWVKVI